MTEDGMAELPPYTPPPIYEFEGKRVDVNFFRIGPEPKRTIRERYEREAFLNMNHVGEDKHRGLVGHLRATQGRDELWKLHWDGRLDSLGWEEREHLRGALNRLQRELLDLDVHDALCLVGRHEGHHIHRHVTHFTCSCDDEVILSVFTGAGSLAEAHCEQCGLPGVLLSQRYSDDQEG